MKKLLEVIDESQLSVVLGGQNQSPLAADAGPWNDFELVDGYEKGAVVGVRRKGTTELFTPQHLERLPNPKLSPEAQ